MSARNVAQVVASAIEDLGAGHIFVLMGAGNLRLIHHLAADTTVRVHHLRHENAAIAAAHGAAALGEVGWCSVTQGPGFTNAVTALGTASRGRQPLVLVVSDSSFLSAAEAPFAGGAQGVDPRPILEAIGVPWVDATRDDAAAAVRRAHARARDERRPVALILPLGIESQPSDEVVPALDPATPARAAVDEADVTALAEALSRAQRPLIVAGRAGADEEQAVRALADTLGASIATTVKGVGAFHDAPGFVGILGGFSTPEAAAVVADADVVLAIGASLNPFQTRRGDLLAGKVVLQVDVDPSAIGRHVPVAHGVVGTAADVVPRLAAVLGSGERGSGERRPAPAGAPAGEIYTDTSAAGLLDPRALCERLDAVLPRDRRVVVDIGHFCSFPISHLTYRNPGELVWLSDFGSVGGAIGAAIAVAVMEPDRQAALFIGDCGLLMSAPDLETVVRLQLPLIIVCMNDGAAGSELVHMAEGGIPPDEAIFGYTDISAIARGFGAEGVIAETLDEAEAAVRGWTRRGPLVLDCRMTRTVRSPIYAHL